MLIPATILFGGLGYLEIFTLIYGASILYYFAKAL